MKIYNNYHLTDLNSFKLPSIVDTIYYPETFSELKVLISDIPDVSILAGGTNVLLKEYYEEIVSLDLLPQNITRIYDYLCVDCNVKTQKLINYTIQNSLAGLEGLWGLPGTVGGAITMNAGSGEDCISNKLYSVTTLTRDGQIKIYQNKDLKFNRRYSIIQDTNDIILQAVFNLPVKKINKEKIQQAKVWRQSFASFASAGGVFTNWHALKPHKESILEISNDYIKVWDKHINVLLNKGNARYDDVIRVINQIQEIVPEPLQLEIKIL